jgi:hypothetical protein
MQPLNGILWFGLESIKTYIHHLLVVQVNK